MLCAFALSIRISDTSASSLLILHIRPAKCENYLFGRTIHYLKLNRNLPQSSCTLVVVAQQRVIIGYSFGPDINNC